MAASLFSHPSSLRSQPSFSPLKTPRIPLFSRASTLSIPSKVGSLEKKKLNNGFVAKSSMVAPKSTSELDNPLIVIDNYDSFTYNLCQYMGELGCHFEVYRNDEITVEELKRKNPRGVLISPGPGTPKDSGISLETVVELGPLVPLFGVCMGLQCIGEAYGGKIVRAPYGVMHGKSSPVYFDEKEDDSLFSGLPNPFTAGRYHSLVIDSETFPSEELEITAWTEDGLIMAARHKKHRHLLGVQFHPESIITSEGKIIIRNFLKMVDQKAPSRKTSTL
ncbi:Anthranilate synthase component 2 [Euphorbia peplus]|nr:Anthranilate synthase component 2 [Euphorbia peplus]